MRGCTTTPSVASRARAADAAARARALALPRAAQAVGAVCIALLATCLALGQEPDAAPGDLTLDTAVQTIKAATDACRQAKSVPIWEYVPGEDEYARVIKPLVEAGPRALPLLQQAAQDERLDAVQRRVAEIVAARIEQPELFAQVAPYYEPTPDPWLEKVNPHNDWDVGVGPALPPVSPALMRPEDRRAWEAYEQSEGYRAYQAVIEKYWRLLDDIPEEQYRSYRTLDLALARTKELREVMRRYPRPPRRPDPRFLLAWEEGAMRPPPVAMKEGFLRNVVEIGDPASAPVLGMILRQSAPFGPEPYANDRWSGRLEFFALTGLLKSPDAGAMRELARTVRELEGRNREHTQLTIGRTLAERPDWVEYVDEQYAEHGEGSDAEALRGCIAAHLESLRVPPPAPGAGG